MRPERVRESEKDENEMVVTPWKVSGKIDYDKLVRRFGTQLITEQLLNHIKRHSKRLHLHLRRRVFFSHRDLDFILDEYERGHEFVLYTGRGPYGPVHLGHLVPWIFTKHLQDVFGVRLYFQLTEDERFLIHPYLDISTVQNWAYENSLDFMAVGFDPKKTELIADTRDIDRLFEISLRVAKHVTLSTAKAVFGFEDSSNIGIMFFPAIQAAPCFLASTEREEKVPCLIPAAIDQDPYWRIARDVAPKLGYYKPAQIHCRFFPGLGKGGKMSASIPETCIYTTDTPEAAEQKIMNAYTGGRASMNEHRRLGGDPAACSIYSYFYFLFEESGEALKALADRCRSGEILCDECKKTLASRVKHFLREHQNRREKTKDVVAQLLSN